MSEIHNHSAVVSTTLLAEEALEELNQNVKDTAAMVILGLSSSSVSNLNFNESKPLSAHNSKKLVKSHSGSIREIVGDGGASLKLKSSSFGDFPTTSNVDSPSTRICVSFDKLVDFLLEIKQVPHLTSKSLKQSCKVSLLQHAAVLDLVFTRIMPLLLSSNSTAARTEQRENADSREEEELDEWSMNSSSTHSLEEDFLEEDEKQQASLLCKAAILVECLLETCTNWWSVCHPPSSSPPKPQSTLTFTWQLYECAHLTLLQLLEQVSSQLSVNQDNEYAAHPDYMEGEASCSTIARHVQRAWESCGLLLLPSIEQTQQFNEKDSDESEASNYIQANHNTVQSYNILCQCLNWTPRQLHDLQYVCGIPQQVHKDRKQDGNELRCHYFGFLRYYATATTSGCRHGLRCPPPACSTDIFLSMRNPHRPLPRNKYVMRAVKELWWGLATSIVQNREEHGHRQHDRNNAVVAICNENASEEAPSSMAMQGTGKTAVAALVVEAVNHFYNICLWYSFSGDSRIDGEQSKMEDGGLCYEEYCAVLDTLWKQAQAQVRTVVSSPVEIKKPEWPHWIPIPLEDTSMKQKRQNALFSSAKARMSEMFDELLVLLSSSEENEENAVSALPAHKKILLVLQDVPSLEEIEGFQFSSTVQLLVTTRNNMDVSATDARTIKHTEIPLLSQQEALALFLLEASLEDSHPLQESLEAKAICEYCQFHPLTLRTIARWFGLKLQSAAGVVKGLEEVHQEILTKVGRMRRSGGNFFYELLSSMLSPNMGGGRNRTQLMKLCVSSMAVVFGSTRAVPWEAVQIMWDLIFTTEPQAVTEVGRNTTPIQRKRQLRGIKEALVQLGILQAVAAEATGSGSSDMVKLHPIFEDYGLHLSREAELLGTQITSASVRWNEAFVTAYLTYKVDMDEGGLEDKCRQYALDHLVSHMLRANLHKKVSILLKDERFIQERLTMAGWGKGTTLHLADCERLYCSMKEQGQRDAASELDAIFLKMSAFLSSHAQGHDSKTLTAAMCILRIGHRLSEKRCWTQALAHYKVALTLHEGPSELSAMIYYSTGVIQLHIQENPKAIKSLRRCAQILSEMDGHQHPLYAQARVHLSESLMQVGEYRSAMDHIDKALLVLRQNETSTTKLVSGRALHNKGMLYHKRGVLDEAQRYVEEAIDVLKSVLGDSHGDMAPSWRELGSIFADAKHADGALKCYREAYRLFLLKENSEVERAIVEGHIYKLALNHKKSIKSYNSALEHLKGSQGQRDRISDILHHMATVYIESGDDQMALSKFEESLRERKKQTNQVESADSLSLMGGIHLRGDRLEEALRCFEESLSIRQSQVGDDEKVAETLEKIGKIRMQVGDFFSADTCFEEALRLRETLSGGENEMVAQVLHAIADLKDKMQDYEAALAMFNECLEVRRRVLGPGHSDVATTLYSMGMAHCHNGNNETAVQCFDEALNIRKLLFGAEHESVANTLHSLGLTQYKRGKPEKAVQLLLDALKIWKRIGDAPKAVEALTEIGHIYRKTKEIALAIKCYQECIGLLSREIGQESERVGDLYLVLGHAIAELSKYEETMAHYEKALEIFMKVCGNFDMKVGSVYEIMAEFEFKLGDRERALQFYKEYVHVKEANNSCDDIDFVKALFAIGKIHQLDGDESEARSSWREASHIYNAGGMKENFPSVGLELEEAIERSDQDKKSLFDRSLLRRISKRLSDEVSIGDMRNATAAPSGKTKRNFDYSRNPSFLEDEPYE